MTRKIEVVLDCFDPKITMEIIVPSNRDAEEYIDEFLDSILADEFRYNSEWGFVD